MGRSSTYETQRQAFDRLHDEFGVYRHDLVAGVATLFDYGLIHHRAEIGKQPEILRKEAEQVPGQKGVVACRPEVGEAFDPFGQNAVGRAWPTNKATRSGTVATRPQPGISSVCVFAYRHAPLLRDS